MKMQHDRGWLNVGFIGFVVDRQRSTVTATREFMTVAQKETRPLKNGTSMQILADCCTYKNPRCTFTCHSANTIKKYAN